MISARHAVLRAAAATTVAAGLLATPAPATEPVIDVQDLPRLPPLDIDQARASFTLAPGYRLELAAAEPEITDPVALSFDADGALYVVEMRDYSERRAEKLSRIKRLTDRDGDGRFETATVFLDGLAWATGIICAQDGVFVAASPDILFARDTDGDGIADEQRVVLTGFAGGRAAPNVQALVNSLTFGPDNRIWGATAGNGGTVNGISLEGSDFSFDPRSLALTAESGTAQYGLTFDAAGRRFVCSNSRHLQWVALEHPHTTNTLARPAHPLVDIPIDGPAAEVFRLSPEEPWRVVRTHWRASGVMAGIVEGGGRASGYFTSASGLTVYTGDLLPSLAGQVFVGDVGSNLVHRKHLRETDDGPVAERDPSETRSEFLASTDTWFRPVACTNGPDGALWIIDMYREVIEHPDSLPPILKQHLDLNSGHDRGRLYRVVPANNEPRRRVSLASLDPKALAALTTHPNGWHRTTARRLLIERHATTAIPVLRSLPGSEALATLDGLGALTADDLRRALASPDPSMVSLGLRLVETRPAIATDLTAELAVLTDHPSATVRRHWALTLGQIPWKRKIDHLARLWNHPHATPRLHEAVRLALRSGAEALELLRALPEPDTSLVALIGRSGESAVITETAAWLRATPNGNPARLFSLTTALNDRAATARIADAAAQILANPAADPETRLAAATALTRHQDDATTTLLTTTFLNPATPPPLRAAAWPAVDPARATEVWAAWPGLTASLRSLVLDRAIAQPAWHRSLLDALAAGHLSPREITTAQARQLRATPDPALAALALVTLGPPPPDRQAAIAARLPALQLAGDRQNGESIFRQRCLSCHRHGTEGAEVGPDRVTFRNLGKPTLLASLLDPNREVAPRYFAASVTTTTGEIRQGLLVRDDPASVTLRLVGGQEIDIPRPDITSFERLTQSLMPEGLETGLTDPELASLLEFLIH